MLIVQKFGGSSLADIQRIRRAAERAVNQAQKGNRVIVVVSAQADTTDRMMETAQAVSKAPPERELDAYLSAGEQMSAALMAMMIKELGYEAVSLAGWQAGIGTDGVHGNATVRRLENERIRKELAQGKIVVVAGFQGIDEDGDVTTLGRGGSDTTAVALAVFFKAEKCQIYTDVDGVYDRDPRIYPDAQRYDTIDYDRMLCLAKNGAQVLHDRSVELAKEYGMPLQVLSSFRPGSGTMVMKKSGS